MYLSETIQLFPFLNFSGNGHLTEEDIFHICKMIQLSTPFNFNGNAHFTEQNIFLFSKTIYLFPALKFGGEGDNWEALPGGEALLAVDEQRIRLDLQVVFQAGLVHQQILSNR